MRIPKEPNMKFPERSGIGIPGESKSLQSYTVRFDQNPKSTNSFSRLQVLPDLVGDKKPREIGVFKTRIAVESKKGIDVDPKIKNSRTMKDER
jgi:hypothetical protein